MSVSSRVTPSTGERLVLTQSRGSAHEQRRGHRASGSYAPKQDVRTRSRAPLESKVEVRNLSFSLFARISSNRPNWKEPGNSITLRHVPHFRTSRLF